LLFQSAEWTAQFFAPLFSSRLLVIDLLIALEGICFIEVGRIALGQIKGNLILGVVLHIIRMTCISLVLPEGLMAGGESDYICILVLYSWSLTEVGRYPMYLFPSSAFARWIRLVLPIVTFPIGAISEAVGAYNALSKLWSNQDDVYGLNWVKVGLLVMVVGINSLLGPTLAYPALLKKGLPVLLGKKDRDSSTQQKKSA
jgi:hypothetical protein